MKSLQISILLILAGIGIFWWGRRTAPQPEAEIKIVYDTTRFRNPSPLPQIVETDRYKEAYFELKDALNQVRDSASAIEPTVIIDTVKEAVYVYVPLHNYRFTEPDVYDVTFDAYGVENFDIQVYQKTVTKDVIRTVARSPPRWGVGLQVGYGYYYGDFKPYIGVGIQYNIFTFN